MSNRVIDPVHPGKILREEFLGPVGLSQNKLAQCIGTDPGRINQIVREERSITADTALRLSTFFDTTPEFWMNLQMKYDLETLRDQKGEEISDDITTLDQLET